MNNKQTPMVKCNMTDVHIAATGKAIKALEGLDTPQDAQVVMTLMMAYYSHRFHLDPDRQTKMMNNNMRLLKGMREIVNVLNAIHAYVADTKLFVPKHVVPMMQD